MILSKNKIAAFVIVLLLTLSMTASMTTVPNANAHSPPWNNPTLAFVTVAPNPVGLGQSVNIGFWLTLPPPTASGPYGDRWQNMTVKVTKPDATTETLGPFSSDDTGGSWTSYSPATLGTYTFQMNFPGQTLTANNPPPTGYSTAIQNYIGDYFQPSTSNIATLTVQQEPVGGEIGTPLPTTYWQTPINAMNVHNWYAIGGAFLDLGASGKYNFSSNYNPYTTAPKTPHIIWTRPEAFGGVLGGEFGGTTTYGNYYSTAQYERKFNPVIINGYLYYVEYPGSSTTPTGLVCVDLYTGKTVWTNDANNYGGGSSVQTALTSAGQVTSLRCGQLLDYVSPNQYGGLAYLWTTGTPAGITSTGTALNMFDAKTGTYILSIVNGTSPSLTEDDAGNLIGYYVNSTAGTEIINGVKVTTTGPQLVKWNSTQCIISGTNGAAAWQWRPTQNAKIDFSKGIMWKVPLATNISGAALPATLGIRYINSGYIVLGALDAISSFFNTGYGIFAGYSSDTGQQLWIKNVTLTPFSNIDSSGISFLASNGIWVVPEEQTGKIYGFSMATGEQIWTNNLSPFHPYSSIGQLWGCISNATLYLVGFGGDVWSINMFNGKINWYTNTTKIQGSGGTSTPYGTWPIWTQSGGGIADGMLFLAEGHEYSPPLFLGAQQLAINLTTGELVWSLDAFNVNGRPANAYGIMTLINAYDNQIYAFGKGPSAMTVTTPDPVTSVGSPMIIRGTVTDISAGSQQNAVAMNFPYGLPAVSDASQKAWMEYVYMQQQSPNNATGVPVSIEVLDSNGNYRHIGDTTSDASGMFTFTWTPDIEGDYTVVAIFAGSESYYRSSAETSFHAIPATTVEPSVTSQPIVATTTDLMTYMSVGVIAIIIAIAIATIFIIRKRP